MVAGFSATLTTITTVIEEAGKLKAMQQTGMIVVKQWVGVVFEDLN